MLERPITATREQILRFFRFVPGGNNRQIQDGIALLRGINSNNRLGGLGAV